MIWGYTYCTVDSFPLSVHSFFLPPSLSLSFPFPLAPQHTPSRISIAILIICSVPPCPLLLIYIYTHPAPSYSSYVQHCLTLNTHNTHCTHSFMQGVYSIVKYRALICFLSDNCSPTANQSQATP